MSLQVGFRYIQETSCKCFAVAGTGPSHGELRAEWHGRGKIPPGGGDGLIVTEAVFPTSQVGQALMKPGPPIGHIGFFSAACMAWADPLIASRHSVSTAKFLVNISQLPNMIKNKGIISLY